MTRRVVASALAVLVGTAGCSTDPGVSVHSGPATPSQGFSESADMSEPASASPSAVSLASLPMGRIVYDRFDAPMSWEADTLGTFTLAADGPGEERLAIDGEGDTFHPTLSPDGTGVAVTVFLPPAGPAVAALAELNGSDLVLLDPEGLSDGFLVCEDWSPDGTRLLCTWDDDAHPEAEGIYSVAIDGSDVQRITSSPNPSVVGTDGECGGNDINPAYSPDGLQILFVRMACGVAANPSDDQAGALYTVAAGGGDPERLVEPGQIQSHGVACPGWSPDATRITFVTEDGELQLLDTDGITTIEIESSVTGDAYAFCPAWSPDGSWIIVSLYTDASRTTDLYVVRPDGGDLTRITDTPGTETNVSWGP